MGQSEIIDFLRTKRLCGDDTFFSVYEIAKGLNGGSPHYSAIRRSLLSLRKLNIVESKNKGDVFEWVRTYRLVEKYVVIEEVVVNG